MGKTDFALQISSDTFVRNSESAFRILKAQFTVWTGEVKLPGVVNLTHGNRHSVNRANTKSATVFRISQMRIPSDSLPGRGRKYSAARMGKRQQIRSARIEASSD